MDAVRLIVARNAGVVSCDVSARGQIHTSSKWRAKRGPTSRIKQIEFPNNLQ